ncbi:hypothetical protein EJ04DRAFT_469119 [Polyplosphaeria fusca]|uniref:Uncharacterized protein n=1 Tax=Polyplosphaeria fusca TaxID=682080 RepID=A0A9P4QXI5_9PLEO|nr:hypothetical protein EJ04DRAFT_469119 [Polyplosphaeria fusca]
MPPPRLKRPPRPCHLPWGIPQARWVSNARNNKVTPARGDAHQTSSETPRASNAHATFPTRDDPPTHHDQAQDPTKVTRGWWRTFVGITSSIGADQNVAAKTRGHPKDQAGLATPSTHTRIETQRDVVATVPGKTRKSVRTALSASAVAHASSHQTSDASSGRAKNYGQTKDPIKDPERERALSEALETRHKTPQNIVTLEITKFASGKGVDLPPNFKPKEDHPQDLADSLLRDGEDARQNSRTQQAQARTKERPLASVTPEAEGIKLRHVSSRLKIRKHTKERRNNIHKNTSDHLRIQAQEVEDIKRDPQQLVEQVNNLQQQLAVWDTRAASKHDVSRTRGESRGRENPRLKKNVGIGVRNVVQGVKDVEGETGMKFDPLVAEILSSHSSTQEEMHGAATTKPIRLLPRRNLRRASRHDRYSKTNRPGEGEDGAQRLVRNLHTHSRTLSSSIQHKKIANDQAPVERPFGRPLAETKSRSIVEQATAEPSDELSEQSLFEELFPEASSYTQPYHRPSHIPKDYPRLDPPKTVLVTKEPWPAQKSMRERMIDAFETRSEQTTVLQLLHCSKYLTEGEFRQIAPKGRHIESWQDDALYKIIPGRDPLSLERLPFYYLLFKTRESALAYQNNAARLHKLCSLHRPSNILSAVPLPKGYVEDGEDITAATSSYVLAPPDQPLRLNFVMQPYKQALSTLVRDGGYRPLVPSTDNTGKPIYKVLLHIEGYEPLQQDLYNAFKRHGYHLGITWPFCNNVHAIQRLRDIIDVSQKLRHTAEQDGVEASAEDVPSASQLVMNKLYNRWVVEMDDLDAAKRFARVWHRRLLPESKKGWRVTEIERIVNTELLW